MPAIRTILTVDFGATSEEALQVVLLSFVASCSSPHRCFLLSISAFFPS